MIYSVEIKQLINVILQWLSPSGKFINLLLKGGGAAIAVTEDCIDFVMRLKSQSLRDSYICLSELVGATLCGRPKTRTPDGRPYGLILQ